MMPKNQTPAKGRGKQLIPSGSGAINEERLNELVQQYLDMGDVKSAVFWAEKKIALNTSRNNGAPTFLEIAKYLKVLYIAQEWQMISNYVQHRELQYRHLCFAFFYVAALFNLEKYTDITTLPLGHLKKWTNIPALMPDSVVFVFAQKNAKMTDSDRVDLDGMLREEHYESRLLLLLSRTYLHLQNRAAAAACVENSIDLNPLSCESVTFALKSHLMSVKAIKQCLTECEAEDRSLLEVIFLMLDYYNVEKEATSEQFKELEVSLASDLSVQTAKAFQLYSKGQINAAYEITDDIVSRYGYDDDCLLIHIGCLVELKKTVELYELAHKMVNLSPDKEITWYAIGSYYYSADQHQLARKHFYKCTTINPNFGYGWLAYGHSLSHDREHDQAMNCYLRASRLLENFAEPVLYIGLEYSHANSLKQASDSISDAIGFCSIPNPIILHEQGTVFLADEKFDFACESFFKALITITKVNTSDPLKDLNTLLGVMVDEYWVNLYYNLGVTLFELNKPCCAIACFRKVSEMGIDRDRASMMMGFCYSRAGRPRLAIPQFQRSLAINPGEVSVKNSYDRAVGIVADLPSVVLTELSLNSVLNKSTNLIDSRMPTDNRPNVGRFLVEASLNQVNKVTCERTFKSLRGMSDEDKSPVGDEGQSGIRTSRIRSEEETSESTFTDELDRPRTAPAMMEVIEEDMQTDDNTTADSESMTTSTTSRYELEPMVLDFDTSTSIMEMTPKNFARKSKTIVRPRIGDPNELITDWFMEEVKNDQLRVPDDDLETLRPPPNPRKRVDEVPEHPSTGDFPFLRTPVLRTRMRSGRRQPR